MISIGQVDAERQTAGETGDFDVGVLLMESFLEEESGRFPFDGRVGGNDDFLDFVWLDAA